MNYQFLGDQIRAARKAKGYTLEKVAEILDVSTTFIGQIERAKGIPSLDTLVKIANALEVSIDSLLFCDLNEKAGDSYFLSQVAALTADFNTQERELVLKSISLLSEWKHSLAASESE